MKIFKQLFFLGLVGIFVASCADEPLPFETFDQSQKGAFARKLEDDKGTFFFTDPDNSSFSFTVEFYDDNDGKNVASHDWYVWHRNNITGDVTDKALMVSMPASSFGTNAKSGLPTASYTFTMNDALAALGLTIDDVNGGDDLIFDGFVVKTDGSSFGPDNTGSSLQGNNGFDGIFRFQKPLLCVSALDGTYDFSSEVSGGTGNGTWDGNIGMVQTGKVRFEQVGDGVYNIYTIPGNDVEFLDISFGAYFAGWGYDPNDPNSQGSMPNTEVGAEGNIQIIDACNKLSYTGSSQWGETYAFNSVTVNGPVLILDWINSYGEGAITTITRTDGTDWPALK
ncbi:MAG TPA: hypothetical protein ENJ95_06665 [Bacteroidetes bacterium]|nr:hypothetical protein [Bacteroidota bacterium]